MADNVKEYSPDECKVVVGSATIGGYADGTFISVEQAGNSFERKVGADGEVVRVKKLDRSGTMKLTLLHTSLSNAALTALHESEAIFPVQIKEGDNVVFGAQCWIEKPAAFERGTDAGDAEWTLAIGKVSLNLGGTA